MPVVKTVTGVCGTLFKSYAIVALVAGAAKVIPKLVTFTSIANPVGQFGTIVRVAAGATQTGGGTKVTLKLNAALLYPFPHMM